MPELPDIAVYTECLQRHIGAATLRSVRIANPFVLRTVTPSTRETEGRRVAGVRRIGKRIVIELEAEIYLVLHLMIAGRLHWLGRAGRAATLATFEFDTGALVLTEAGSKRRASLHVIGGEAALCSIDPGGIEILDASVGEFVERLRRGNHTLKRALTDPHLFSGIGNAYSDEILHRARLSPFALTGQIEEADAVRLFDAARATLNEWTERLRAQAGGVWPDKVTAFRDGMAVHGRFGKPCPVCAAPVQRIVYAENECDYCARCQTGGKIFADRALSRLLKANWPRSIDELG